MKLEPCPNPECEHSEPNTVKMFSGSAHQTACKSCFTSGPMKRGKANAETAWNNLPRPASGGLEGAVRVVEETVKAALEAAWSKEQKQAIICEGTVILSKLRALPDSGEVERIAEAGNVIEGLLSEWDKLTRYGSPMAKAANEQVARARAFIATTTPEDKP